MSIFDAAQTRRTADFIRAFDDADTELAIQGPAYSAGALKRFKQAEHQLIVHAESICSVISKLAEEDKNVSADVLGAAALFATWRALRTLKGR